MFFGRQAKVSRPIQALVGFGLFASWFTTSANAATSLRLAYDDGSNTISGVLLADNLGGGQFHAIGGSVQETAPRPGSS